MSKESDAVRSESEAKSITTNQKPAKTNQMKDLEQRLSRLEKRIKNNERFARTFTGCLETQVVAVDAVTTVMRRALRDDAMLHDELVFAIKEYDRRKISRWFSGFLGVLLRISALAIAGLVGAFIYWVFYGK